MVRTTLGGWVVAGVVVGGCAPLAAQAPCDDPVVAVVLDDTQHLLRHGLPFARDIVRDTYRKAGVAIVWGREAAATADRVLSVTFTTAASASAGLGPHALGVAPSPGDGTRGTAAVVFVDRVLAYADAHGVSLSYVLAGVIAHEIGHHRPLTARRSPSGLTGEPPPPCGRRPGDAATAASADRWEHARRVSRRRSSWIGGRCSCRDHA